MFKNNMKIAFRNLLKHKGFSVINIAAWSVGYFAMRSWLRNFAYRTGLTAPIFLGAALAAFLIAAGVVSLQTYRAEAVDPAVSMRYE